jgi:putative ABC transport system permease protein
MWMLRLAWLNLWRNKGRTLISMAAVFFAVILSIVLTSLTDGSFDHLINNLVGYYTGYVQVHKTGYWDEQILDNSFQSSATLEDSIRQVKNVSAAAPRLESFALAASGDLTKGVMVVGIDPQKENRATSLEEKMVSGEYLSALENEVLLGEGLAKRLKLTLHDTLVLIGQGYHGSTAAGKYRIKGIIRFGAPELNERMLFMPLTTAQELFGADQMITSYVLILDDTKSLDETTQQLRSILSTNYEVMSWEEIMPDIKQHMISDKANMKIFQAILYVLVAMGIFGTMLMMMVERTFELGMLMAIGMKKSKMILLLVSESVLTVMGGCLIGISMSIPIVYYMKIHPIRFTGEMGEIYERFGFEAVLPTSTAPDNFIWQGVIVLCIGLFLSIYPVWKVLRLDPVISMKR